MAAPKDPLVLLAVAGTEIEANVWRDVLAADGIGCFVKNTDPFSSFGVTPPPNSLELYVKESDEKRARWLLGDRIEGNQPA